jgi:acyl-CoA thioesterase FadM
LFGFLLFVVGELAVTRSLQVEYLRPVRLEVPYVFTAGLDRRDGRELHLTAQLHQPNGREVAQAAALFMVVPVEHFVRALQGR